MSVMRRAMCSGAIAIAIASLAAPTLAGPSPAPTPAQVEFDTAQQLFDGGRQAEALPHFRKAYEISKSPNARLMIARCLIAVGKTTEAYEEMAATTREAAARADTDAKYAPTRDAAAAELVLLDRRVGKIIVALADPGPGTSVTLNGAALSADRVGVPVAVDPGKMVVEATRAGSKPVRREIAVGAGETKTVAIAFTGAATPDGAGAKTPGGDQGTPKPDAKRGGGVRIGGFVVTAIGLAGMGVFAGAGIAARGKFSTLQKECGMSRCTDPKYGDVVDSGKMFDLMANIGLGVGIAGIVGGGLMIALGGPSKAPAQAAVDIGPSMIGLRYSGSF